MLFRSRHEPGHTADVSFVGHIRDMVKYNSVEELTAAITADVEKVREILGIADGEQPE